MAKTRKVEKVGIEREAGFLYFVDKDGDVSRAPMKKSGKKGGKKKVAKVGLKKRKGYMYFIDGKGDICEVEMSRKGAKRKPRSKLATPTEKYLVYTQAKVRGASSTRAKKVLLAAKCRRVSVSSPSTAKGKYGVKVRYEAKVGKTYQTTEKFVQLAKPAKNIRLVNKVPKKYQ